MALKLWGAGALVPPNVPTVKTFAGQGMDLWTGPEPGAWVPPEPGAWPLAVTAAGVGLSTLAAAELWTVVVTESRLNSATRAKHKAMTAVRAAVSRQERISHR